MTRLTAVHAYSNVFEKEGPAFVGMAAQAGLFVHQSLIHHARPGAHAPRGRRRAMWIMTVGAGHEPFVDTVLRRHVELGSNLIVAVVAEVYLLFSEQELRCRRTVN